MAMLVYWWSVIFSFLFCCVPCVYLVSPIFWVISWCIFVLTRRVAVVLGLYLLSFALCCCCFRSCCWCYCCRSCQWRCRGRVNRFLSSVVLSEGEKGAWVEKESCEGHVSSQECGGEMTLFVLPRTAQHPPFPLLLPLFFSAPHPTLLLLLLPSLSSIFLLSHEERRIYRLSLSLYIDLIFFYRNLFFPCFPLLHILRFFSFFLSLFRFFFLAMNRGGYIGFLCLHTSASFSFT